MDDDAAHAVIQAFIATHADALRDPPHPGEVCRWCQHDHWLERCKTCDCPHHCVCPPEEHDQESWLRSLSWLEQRDPDA